MSADNEIEKKITEEKGREFSKPSFSPVSYKYCLDNSHLIDKVPQNTFVYTEALRGCQVLICRSKKDEFAYYHIHPEQVFSGLDIRYIKETLKKGNITPNEFLIISTDATILKDKFFGKIKQEYGSLKINQVHINTYDHCDVYFKSKNGELIVAERISYPQQTKYHQSIIRWTPIIRGYFFKPRELDEKRLQKEENKVINYISKFMHEGLGGSEFRDGLYGGVKHPDLEDCLKSDSISEMCTKAAKIVEKYNNNKIYADENHAWQISSSINMLIFLSQCEDFNPDDLLSQIEAREDELNPTVSHIVSDNRQCIIS